MGSLGELDLQELVPSTVAIQRKLLVKIATNTLQPIQDQAK